MDKRLDWVNVTFFAIFPPLAVAAAAWHTFHFGLHPVDLALFAAFFCLSGLGITAGYHRLFSHTSYKASPALQLFYLLAGASAFENSALRWSRDHRIHHQKVDQEEDPYNIKKGFFWAHIGWIFYKSPKDEDFTVVPDLLKNRLVMWQERHYLSIGVAMSLLFPLLIGSAFGRPIGGLLWGGALRLIVFQHCTFSINSLAHWIGSQPYSVDNTARDSGLVAVITMGEGYHNFHHRFAGDYRNGHRWYHFDPGKWFIRAMAFLGLAGRLTRYREELILKARVETDLKKLHAKAAASPEAHLRLKEARTRLEAAAQSWASARAEYRRLKGSLSDSRALAALRASLRRHSFELEAAQARWAVLIAAVGRLSGNS